MTSERSGDGETFFKRYERLMEACEETSGAEAGEEVVLKREDYLYLLQMAIGKPARHEVPEEACHLVQVTYVPASLTYRARFHPDPSCWSGEDLLKSVYSRTGPRPGSLWYAFEEGYMIDFSFRSSFVKLTSPATARGEEVILKDIVEGKVPWFAMVGTDRALPHGSSVQEFLRFVADAGGAPTTKFFRFGPVLFK